MESFSDDLAGVGNQNKGRRIICLDKVTEFDCLLTVQRCKNNVSLFTGKGSVSQIVAPRPSEWTI